MKIVINYREQLTQVELLGSGDLTGEKLFVIGNEFGATHLVTAYDACSAWEEWLDEQPTIPDDEVREAYGFDTQEAMGKAREDDNPIELIEGYEYQANCTGTGIVNVDHYTWISEATIESLNLK